MPIIVTYNVLCQALANKNAFPLATDYQLDPKIRLQKLKTKLDGWIQQHAVICLQEVSRTWYLDLVSFFKGCNYTFIFMSYGIPAADYMGVGIAFPNKYIREGGGMYCRYEGGTWGGRIGVDTSGGIKSSRY